MMNVGELPVGTSLRALSFEHFPAPFLAVIWRNWNLIAPERLAKVLHCTVTQLQKSAEQLGLTTDGRNLEKWLERGFLTLIRRNWHLLNYEQLLELLDWEAEKLDCELREDDFLWEKQGGLKPQCDPVYYRELSDGEALQCERIRQIMAQAPAIPNSSEAPFDFLEKKYWTPSFPAKNHPAENLRLIYSYFALYGDPFLPESVDPYPEKILEEYAANGINAVWLPALLYTLTPWLGDIDLSRRWPERQKRLRELAQRTRKYGIRLFLYFNEPRMAPGRAFQHYPQWRGAKLKDRDVYTMCPEAKGMLDAFSNGVAELCRSVPELGGFFTITMSENWTHCLSRNAPELESPCPVCATKDSPASNVGAVLRAIFDGMNCSAPDMELIAWNWGWDPAWDQEVVKMLPPEVRILCVSENSLPTDCRGIAGEVNDYSISQVGPGPTAKRLWRIALQNGHRAIAKVQVNATWELATIPWIPVPQLVREHREKIAACGIDDAMLSWTLGGWSGGNLMLFDHTLEEWLHTFFPQEDWQKAQSATAQFSAAFRLFPFHGTNLIYTGPINFGCSNLLFARPTGYAATMVGFPYDDLSAWTGRHYPEELFEDIFGEITERWHKALDVAHSLSDSPGRQELVLMGEAAYCHLRSAYLQIAFIRRRNAGKFEDTAPLLREEIDLAWRYWSLMQQDSRLGFEASNHYAFTSNDLLEKIINCHDLLSKISLTQQRLSTIR